MRICPPVPDISNSIVLRGLEAAQWGSSQFFYTNVFENRNRTRSLTRGRKQFVLPIQRSSSIQCPCSKSVQIQSPDSEQPPPRSSLGVWLLNRGRGGGGEAGSCHQDSHMNWYPRIGNSVLPFLDKITPRVLSISRICQAVTVVKGSLPLLAGGVRRLGKAW